MRSYPDGDSIHDECSKAYREIEAENAKLLLQIQEHQNKAAEWVEYVFEKNTEARFKTGYMRGFVQGLAEAFRQGLHLKQTEKRVDLAPKKPEDIQLREWKPDVFGDAY